ncbi:hypothetical protein TNCV_454661 [Trichonephila clavipes]|nr:hypothetical protein TNCV_454661 [Trichonephila clavipes]
MESLGHSSFPPTALGQQDDEEAAPGVKSLQLAHDVQDTYRFRSMHQSASKLLSILSPLEKGMALGTVFS